MTKLRFDTKNAELIYEKLIQDYYSRLPKEERVLKHSDIPAIIYNLFNGKYQFSYKEYKYIFEKITSL